MSWLSALGLVLAAAGPLHIAIPSAAFAQPEPPGGEPDASREGEGDAGGAPQQPSDSDSSDSPPASAAADATGPTESEPVETAAGDEGAPGEEDPAAEVPELASSDSPERDAEHPEEHPALRDESSLEVRATQEATEELLGDMSSIEDLSLGDLMELETRVSSPVPQTIREAPGVITIVTRDEIIDSGARDLIDVLRLVPGFDFGVDVLGTIGVGFRGNWGHEGKVLLLWDGVPMNETLYSTLQFNNHYPVEHIERLEVIRGPGSVTYGGYAELAVINVITRRSDEGGLRFSAVGGVTDRTFARRRFSLGYDQTFGDARVHLNALFGQGNPGDELVTDFAGEQYRLSDHTADPAHISLGASYQELQVGFLYDRYRQDHRDGFDLALPGPVKQVFEAYGVNVRHQFDIGDRVRVRPYFRFNRYEPFQVEQESVGTGANEVDLLDLRITYQSVTNRYHTGLNLEVDLMEERPRFGSIVLLLGTEFYYERADARGLVNTRFGADQDPTVNYWSGSGFAELSWRSDLLNVTAGGRFEKHSQFGAAVVPRVALSRVFGDFHAKLLFSQAFRAPAIENISLNPDIRPETTTIWEAEFGYLFNQSNFLSVNAFWADIDDPIIYFFDEETGDEGYSNFDATGTRGFEVEYRLRYPQAQLTTNYSFYTSRGADIPADYAVLGQNARGEDVDREETLLGFASHKFTLRGTLFVDRLFSDERRLRVSPTVVVYGKRYGFYSADAEGNPVLGATDPAVLLHLFVDYELPFVEGLHLAAGVYDLFDTQDDVFAQPYNGYHPALPGRAREYLVRLRYDHPF